MTLKLEALEDRNSPSDLTGIEPTPAPYPNYGATSNYDTQALIPLPPVIVIVPYPTPVPLPPINPLIDPILALH